MRAANRWYVCMGVHTPYSPCAVFFRGGWRFFWSIPIFFDTTPTTSSLPAQSRFRRSYSFLWLIPIQFWITFGARLVLAWRRHFRLVILPQVILLRHSSLWFGFPPKNRVWLGVSWHLYTHAVICVFLKVFRLYFFVRFWMFSVVYGKAAPLRKREGYHYGPQTIFFFCPIIGKWKQGDWECRIGEGNLEYVVFYASRALWNYNLPLCYPSSKTSFFYPWHFILNPTQAGSAQAFFFLEKQSSEYHSSSVSHLVGIDPLLHVKKNKQAIQKCWFFYQFCFTSSIFSCKTAIIFRQSLTHFTVFCDQWHTGMYCIFCFGYNFQIYG